MTRGTERLSHSAGEDERSFQVTGHIVANSLEVAPVAV